MTSPEIEAMLERSRIAQVHGVKLCEHGQIVAIATADETGADGMVSNAFLTLMLVTAAHTEYGNSTPYGGFTITPVDGLRAKIGDRLVASAFLHHDEIIPSVGRILKIHATVRVGSVVYATGVFTRKCT